MRDCSIMHVDKTSPRQLGLKCVLHPQSVFKQFQTRTQGPRISVQRKRQLRLRPEANATITKYVERSQETLRSIYLKALPGPWSFAPSFLVPLAAALSALGAANGHHLLEYLQTLPAPDWLPMARTLQQQYASHTYIANVGIDTLLSTLALLLIFLGLPAMDLILGTDPKTAEEAEGSEGAYKRVLHAHVATYWLVLAAAMHATGTSSMHPLTLLGLSTSVAMAGDMSFVVAHELLHSRSSLDKTMASAALLPLAYMHWVPSHIAHHRKVGTAEDATTARFGEPLYRFVPRSVVGNLQDGIHSELLRLKSRHLHPLHPQNRIYQWALGPLALLAASYTLWGPSAACLGVLQALIGVFALEDVNYIEHYGLQRQLGEHGRYERISVWHSWNANWLFSNSVIFSVQRHSDHHAHAYKPYQKLNDLRNAPQLPASYSSMMILALFPGLFFDVMDPRAIEIAQKKGNALDLIASEFRK